MIKNGEKSFSKLFELLEIIAGTDHGISGKEPAAVSGIPQSTTFRMLKFMADHDYLRADHGLYSLGTGFIRLGNAALQQHPLMKLTRPILEELSRQTQETVHLAEQRFTCGKTGTNLQISLFLLRNRSLKNYDKEERCSCLTI